MNRVRLWILGVTLGSFAAGMSVGLVVTKVASAQGEKSGVDADYVRELVTTYGLSSGQERLLRFALQSWREEEIAVLTSAEATQLPEPIQRRLLQASRQLEQRIRALLDPEQRARYDEASRPTEPR